MSLTPQRIPIARELARDPEPSAIPHKGFNRPYVNGEFINLDNHKPIVSPYPKSIKIGRMPSSKKYPNALHWKAWDTLATPSKFELLGQAIVNAQNQNLEKQLKRQDQMSSGIPSIPTDETGFKVRATRF